MNDIPEWATRLCSPLDEKLDLVLTELSPNRVSGSIPVEGNEQPFGLLHGGASGVLVETLASMGALAYGYPQGMMAVGVDLHVTHLAAARSGRVTGVATAVKLGKSTAMYRVELRNDDGELTAVGSLTCKLVKTPTAN